MKEIDKVLTVIVLMVYSHWLTPGQEPAPGPGPAQYETMGPGPCVM